jgi:hypothetical protein
MNFQDILNLILGLFGSSDTTPVVPSFNGTQLAVVRTHTDTFSTLGTFSVNGSPFCFCVELPKVPYDGSNICIPCGTYGIDKYFSPDHGFDVPLLLDVPNRTSIEIHPSNWAINPDTKRVYLLGCIAVGDKEDGTDAVDDSQTTFAKLMSAIDWTRPVQITVTEQLL